MSEQYKDPSEAPFMYCAKASRSERDRGCEDLYWHFEGNDPRLITKDEYNALKAQGERVVTGAIHPTIKPVQIMEWLVERLTEPGDVVLDPFAGSGTTGIAALNKGRNCILIELDEDGSYEPIIRGRLRAAKEDLLRNVPVWEPTPEVSVPGEEEAEDAREEKVGFGDFFG